MQDGVSERMRCVGISLGETPCPICSPITPVWLNHPGAVCCCQLSYTILCRLQRGELWISEHQVDR